MKSLDVASPPPRRGHSKCCPEVDQEQATTRCCALLLIVLLIIGFILGLVYASNRTQRLSTEVLDTMINSTFSVPCLKTLVAPLLCHPSKNIPESEVVRLRLSFSTMEPSVSGAGGTATGVLRFDWPTYLSRSETLPFRSRNFMFILVGDFVLTFKPDEIVNMEYTFKVPVNAGTLTEYPFDNYRLDLNILFAVFPNNYNSTFPGFPDMKFSIGGGEPIPFFSTPNGAANFDYVTANGETLRSQILRYNGSLDMTQFTVPYALTLESITAGPFEITTTRIIPSTIEKDNPGFLRIMFARPNVSKIYPMCVVIGMWGILIAECLVLYWMVVLRYRKTDNPALLAFFAAVIFALPSLRNSLPFQPPLGCLLDFGSFFWAEIVAMGALLLISIRFVLDSAPPAAPAAQVARPLATSVSLRPL
eukprot:TRINITY_DN4346_c0_g1_i4.p1 TRINITY_DN4346_c0_g1~~TRINITY_DN4346_c0_g1_i4.p1  ORF type:complete len:419 (+),score=62.57 TRINITY_DN4346_c0_g1_i4:76-1332(+)